MESSVVHFHVSPDYVNANAREREGEPTNETANDNLNQLISTSSSSSSSSSSHLITISSSSTGSIPPSFTPVSSESPSPFSDSDTEDNHDNPITITSDAAQITLRLLSFTVKIADPSISNPSLAKSKSKTLPTTALPPSSASSPLHRLFAPKPPPISKQILKDVTTTFNPGRLTAIMGASGAGKTSLLNCLAGYANNGDLTGDIFVNSERVTPSRMKRISAYVFQDDVILASQTIREAIHMAAILRLPLTMSRQEKIQRAEEIIRVLGLNKAADNLIGNERMKGISGGERRRTSIGMQMVTNPSIMFLDEPTSGLDTFTAYSVCKILKTVANKHGKTIVATIHQPSSEIFHMFDDLVLMAEGHIVYCGPTRHAMNYFAARGFPCPRHHNPSDHFFNNILHNRPKGHSDDETDESSPPDSPTNSQHSNNGNSIGNTLPASNSSSASSASTFLLASKAHGVVSSSSALVEQQDKEEKETQKWLIEQWNNSNEGQLIVKQVEAKRAGPAPQANTATAPFTTQFHTLLQRAARNTKRDPLVFKAKMGQTIVIAIIVSLLYLGVVNNQTGIQNRLGALFFNGVQMLFGGSMAIMNIFAAEKAVLLREHSGGMYRLPAYFLSRVVVELPTKIFFPFLFGTINYWIIGFQSDGTKFILFLITLSLTDFVGGAIGLALANAFPDIQVAMAIMPMILLPLMVFSGYFVNSGAIPVFLSWIQYISPVKYTFMSLVKGEFEGLKLWCTDSQYQTTGTAPNITKSCAVTTGEQEIALLDFDNQPSQSESILILVAMYVGLSALAYLGLHKSTKNFSGKSK